MLPKRPYTTELYARLSDQMFLMPYIFRVFTKRTFPLNLCKLHIARAHIQTGVQSERTSHFFVYADKAARELSEGSFYYNVLYYQQPSLHPLHMRVHRRARFHAQQSYRQIIILPQWGRFLSVWRHMQGVYCSLLSKFLCYQNCLSSYKSFQCSSVPDRKYEETWKVLLNIQRLLRSRLPRSRLPRTSRKPNAGYTCTNLPMPLKTSLTNEHTCLFVGNISNANETGSVIPEAIVFLDKWPLCVYTNTMQIRCNPFATIHRGCRKTQQPSGG